MDDVTDKLLATASTRSSTPMDKLIARHRVERARRSSPAARRRSSPRSPTSSSRRSPSGSKRGRGGRRARGSGSKDATLWGGPGARARQPARLADDRRAHAEDARRPRGVRRGGRRPTASPTPRCSGMGGSSLGPEVFRRSFGDTEAACALHVLDSTDPGAVLDARGRGRPGQDALHRLLEVRRDDRDALALPATSTSASEVGPTATSSSRSPTRAARSRSSAPSTASGACSTTTRTSAGATRCCRTSGSCRRRLWASTSRRCCDRCQVAEQNCNAYDSTQYNCGPVAGARAGRARAARAATSSPSWSSSRSSSFGLWVEQLIAESHRQGGQGHPAGGRRAAGRARRLRRRPRVRVPARRREARRGPRREGPGARRRRTAAVIRSPARRRGPGPRSSSSPSSPPPSRAGCWGSTRSTSPTSRRPRTRPTRCWMVSPSGALPDVATPTTTRSGAARRRRAAALRGDHGLRRALGGVRRGGRSSCARRSATRPRRRRRSATGRASCTRPASSTRAARPSACSSSWSTTAGEDVEIPGRAVHVRDAQERAGHRRPGDASRARAAGRAGSPRGRPVEAVRQLTSKIKEIL